MSVLLTYYAGEVQQGEIIASLSCVGGLSSSGTGALTASGSITQMTGSLSSSGTGVMTASGSINAMTGSLSSTGTGSLPSGSYNMPASTVYDYDVTQADSYSGSGQTFASLTPSPADGSSTADWDLYLGATSSATTDDPTYTGSGDTAYFAFDGTADHFKLQSGTWPAFMRDAHKGSAADEGWFAFAMRTGSNTASMWILNATDGASPRHGVAIRHNGTGVAVFQIFDGASVANNTITNGSLGAGEDVVWIVSYKKSTSTLKCWTNSSTPYLDTSLSSLGLAATDADGAGEFGKFGSNYINSDIRLYAWSGGNELLDNTKAGEILAEYNSRHGRTYS